MIPLAVAGLALLAAIALVPLHGGWWRDAPAWFAGCGLAAGGAYLAAAAWVWRRPLPARAWRLVAVVAVAAHGLGLRLDPSDDLNRYAVEGQQLAIGENPYAVPPRASAAPVAATVAAQVNHPHMTAIYPSGMLAWHGTAGVLTADPRGYAALHALASLLLIAVVGLALHRAGAGPGRWLIVAWHPLLPLMAGGEGHHDAVAALAAVAAVLLLAGGGFRAALVASLACLLKPFALPVLVTVLHAGRWRWWWLPPVVAALAYLPFLDAGAGVLRSLGTFAGTWQHHGVVEPWLRWLPESVNRFVLLAALLGGGWWLWRRSPDPFLRAGRLVALLMMVLPTLHAWYLIALVPWLAWLRSPALTAWTGLWAVYWLHGHWFPPGGWQEAWWISALHLPFAVWFLVETHRRPEPAP